MATAGVACEGDRAAIIAQRLKEKILQCDGFNPWDIRDEEWQPAQIDNMPLVTEIDLFTYLVVKTSFYTGRQMKARKSLLAHNFYVSGFVEKLRSHQMSGDRILVTANVKHSQSMNAPPLRPWFLAHQDGTIHVAHCHCMAGLDEVCSHIAALMFAVETGVRLTEQRSCTSLPCSWIMPGTTKKVPYAEVRRMDLRSAARKKRDLDTQGKVPTALVELPTVSKPKGETTEEELYTLLRQIHIVFPQAGILSVSHEFHHEYTPKHHVRPQVLTELRDPTMALQPYHILIDHCHNIKLAEIPQEAITTVEFVTRGQVKRHEWFTYRAGRITASNMRAICHTPIENPSVSLIEQVCYPRRKSFTSEATRWGNEKEAVARAEYKALLAASHVGLDVSRCGLVLNETYPEMGASPDGKVRCQCCDDGFLEIKCPFTLKDVDFGKISEEQLPDACCLKFSDGNLKLDHDHQYYYQVQTQLFLGEADYCDFMVWTGKGVPHIERILPDPIFWDSLQATVKSFFRKAVLPELVAGWFTRPYIEDVPHPADMYCYCGRGESGTMIMCDCKECVYVWYHTSCLLIDKIPKGKWLCPSCRKAVQQRKRSQRKSVKASTSVV